MKKILLVAAAAIILAGCEEPNSVGKVYSNSMKFQELCIDGVVYLYRRAPYRAAMSIKFNPDGSVITCK